MIGPGDTHASALGLRRASSSPCPRDGAELRLQM